MSLDAPTFVRAVKGITFEYARAWSAALDAAAEQFGIVDPDHQAMWLAQLAHESSGFTRLEENLNYSAERLAQVWPFRYALDPRAIHKRPNELARSIGGNPELVANNVYANRLGNGQAESGEGWKYRGRYPLQLTGKANYTAAWIGCGVPDIEDPDALLLDIPGMARVCGWFWQHNHVGEHASRGDFDGVCDAWNLGHKTDRVGDSIGYADRVEWHKRWLVAMGIG